MDELDSEPTLVDINQALDQLSFGKAPRNDGIPVEVIKCAKGTLLKELHEILCQCWREGEVPQDMRDANIVTLYKNKGDRGDCNNYRGISPQHRQQTLHQSCLDETAGVGRKNLPRVSMWI